MWPVTIITNFETIGTVVPENNHSPDFFFFFFLSIFWNYISLNFFWYIIFFYNIAKYHYYSSLERIFNKDGFGLQRCSFQAKPPNLSQYKILSLHMARFFCISEQTFWKDVDEHWWNVAISQFILFWT